MAWLSSFSKSTTTTTALILLPACLSLSHAASSQALPLQDPAAQDSSTYGRHHPLDSVAGMTNGTHGKWTRESWRKGQGMKTEKLSLEHQYKGLLREEERRQFSDRVTDTVTRVRGGERDKENANTIMGNKDVNNAGLGSLGWFSGRVNVTTRPLITWSSTPSHKEDGVARSAKGGDVEVQLTVELLSEGHHLVLDLHPNRQLLARSYSEPDVGAAGADSRGSGRRGGKGDPSQCEYQGEVRGQQESWVALYVCGGLSGVVVMVRGALEEELLVEPSPGSSSPQEPHRITSVSLLQQHAQGTCGVRTANMTIKVGTDAATTTTTTTNAGEREGDLSSSFSFSSSRERRAAGLVGGPLWMQGSTRFVELVLVADHSFYLHYGANVRSRCRAMVNIVNAIYRPLGVVVVLSHVEVWEARDQVQVTADHEHNLRVLKDYRLALLKDRPDLNNDNTMLLTTVDFIGTTVGFATVFGMCGDKDSVGVVQDKKREVGVTAQTLAHEMGHNLGLNHDEDTPVCPCDTNGCIMSDTSSYRYKPSTGWSQCSKQNLAKALYSTSFDCLRNVPDSLMPGSNCGDGVVDLATGEQCDCGPPEFCTNPCCDSSTCKFVVNATCASGSCCDTQTCQPRPPGEMCRAAHTDCDLPEFCSGHSEYCPADVHKADGASCRERKGHCYKGQCGSHQDRCQAVWGRGAGVAAPQCYAYNTRGSSEGNCGFSDQSRTRLAKCPRKDEQCGSLQCDVPTTTKPTIKGSYRFGSISCGRGLSSYILASDGIPSSFWLTPDGAACGENKMCVGQRCAEISAPSGDCEGGCSGRGVCNSLGHCHCEDGFAPPDCSELGNGGSVDSGQMSRNRDVNPAVEAVFFLFMVILAVVIILCCLWRPLRGWWEGGGRARFPRCCALCMDACCCPLVSSVNKYIFPDCLFMKKKSNVTIEDGNKGERDSMICQVNVDIENKSQTFTWGVADGMQVTDVLTLTPKKSAECRKIIRLTPDSPAAQNKRVEELDRPTYHHQSVSVDSGCVSDGDEIVTRGSFKSQMSMKSLANMFGRFGSRASPIPEGESQRESLRHDSQKSMKLSRFVVDPLAGGRGSRQETPSPDPLRPEWCRSVSAEVTPRRGSRPGGTPSPPPVIHNIHNNRDNSPPWPKQMGKHSLKSKNNKEDSEVSSGSQQPVGQVPKTPLRLSPDRPAPAPPHTTTSLSTSGQAKKPMMPPKQRKPITVSTKKTSAELASDNNKTPFKPALKTNDTSSRGPLQPQKKVPLRPPLQRTAKPPGPPKPPTSAPESRAQGSVSAHPVKGTSVRDLAKRLEKQ